jgi:hypothetical protein
MLRPTFRRQKTAHETRRHTLVLTFITFTSSIVLLLLLSTIDGQDGEPWISESLIGQTLGLLLPIAGLFGPALARTVNDGSQVKEQVKNNHVENFREENSAFHAEVLRSQSEVLRRFDATDREIAGLRKDVGRLYDWREKGLEDRFRDLERTQPTRRDGDG